MGYRRSWGAYDPEQLSAPAMTDRAIRSVKDALGEDARFRGAAVLSNDGLGFRIDVTVKAEDAGLARERLARIGRSYGAVRIFILEAT